MFEITTPLQFGMPGGIELVVVLLVLVLLFGANKIPKLARSTGQAMGEFQRGRQELEEELEEMKEPPESGSETGSEASSSESSSAETSSSETAEETEEERST